jgi:hypothetical protein
MALELFSGPNGAVLALAVIAVVLAAKHTLADFVLQTEWMARGKERAQGWELPLAAHAGVHGLGMLLVALVFRPGLWWLALADVAIHAGVDRGKALASLRLRLPMSDPRFWWLLGFDQFLHHVTNVALGTLLIVV